MKFKVESNGTNTKCLGVLDQEIFDGVILAVFEGLLIFYHQNLTLYNAYSVKQRITYRMRLWCKL
jgi:hypothetical protein